MDRWMGDKWDNSSSSSQSPVNIYQFRFPAPQCTVFLVPCQWDTSSSSSSSSCVPLNPSAGIDVYDDDEYDVVRTAAETINLKCKDSQQNGPR